MTGYHKGFAKDVLLNLLLTDIFDCYSLCVDLLPKIGCRSGVKKTFLILECCVNSVVSINTWAVSFELMRSINRLVFWVLNVYS